jgi:hypothetical protein
MEKIALKTLVQKGIVRTISNLRENTNEYPYLTFLDSKGKSTNIYFGQKSGVIIKDTFEIGASVISAIKDADIIKTTNASGEERFKISLNVGNSNYASDTELLDAFGIEDLSTEFNFSDFQAQFVAKETTIKDPA